METKFCKKCGKEKPVSEFIPDGRYRCGYQTYCRKCVSEYQKQRRQGKERQATADFDRLLGGFKVSILNYAKNREYKYTVASTKGGFFQTNSKEEFINFIKERA